MTVGECFTYRIHGESLLSEWCLPELTHGSYSPSLKLMRRGNDSGKRIPALPSPAHEFALLEGQIIASQQAGLEQASIRRLLYDTIIPECLARRGSILLRAFCVRWRGMGCLILGGAGVGKSTLCAFLLAAGAEFVGDDIIRITLDEDGHPIAWAGSPWLKLWPSAAREFGRVMLPSGVVRPGLDKQLLNVPDALRVDATAVARWAFVATDDRREPGIGALDMTESLSAFSAMMRMPLAPKSGGHEGAAILKVFAALARLPRPRVLFRRGARPIDETLNIRLLDDLLA